jgi:hypothetical protein
MESVEYQKARFPHHWALELHRIGTVLQPVTVVGTGQVGLATAIDLAQQGRRVVLEGKAPNALLDAYAEEREYAADENILNSTRPTDCMTPKSAVSRLFRDAALTPAKRHAFVRRIVNHRRLSLPALLLESTLNTPDPSGDTFTGRIAFDSVYADAPTRYDGQDGWFLERGDASAFAGVYFCTAAEDLAQCGERFACYIGSEWGRPAARGRCGRKQHSSERASCRYPGRERREGSACPEIQRQAGYLLSSAPGSASVRTLESRREISVRDALQRTTCNA